MCFGLTEECERQSPTVCTPIHGGVRAVRILCINFGSTVQEYGINIVDTKRHQMRVFVKKRGNSAAIRIPAAVMEAVSHRFGTLRSTSINQRTEWQANKHAMLMRLFSWRAAALPVPGKRVPCHPSVGYFLTFAACSFGDPFLSEGRRGGLSCSFMAVRTARSRHRRAQPSWNRPPSISFR